MTYKLNLRFILDCTLTFIKKSSSDQVVDNVNMLLLGKKINLTYYYMIFMNIPHYSKYCFICLSYVLKGVQ